MAQTRHLSFVLDDNVTSSHILMDVSANVSYMRFFIMLQGLESQS